MELRMDKGKSPESLVRVVVFYNTRTPSPEFRRYRFSLRRAVCRRCRP
jgi:hypothetical protein